MWERQEKKNVQPRKHTPILKCIDQNTPVHWSHRVFLLIFFLYVADSHMGMTHLLTCQWLKKTTKKITEYTTICFIFHLRTTSPFVSSTIKKERETRPTAAAFLPFCTCVCTHAVVAKGVCVQRKGNRCGDCCCRSHRFPESGTGAGPLHFSILQGKKS